MRCAGVEVRKGGAKAVFHRDGPRRTPRRRTRCLAPFCRCGGGARLISVSLLALTKIAALPISEGLAVRGGGVPAFRGRHGRAVAAYFTRVTSGRARGAIVTWRGVGRGSEGDFRINGRLKRGASVGEQGGLAPVRGDARLGGPV